MKVAVIPVCLCMTIGACVRFGFEPIDDHDAMVNDFQINAVTDAGAELRPDDGNTDITSDMPSLGTAELRYPPNGYTTGSANVPLTVAVVDHPLKPKFMWNSVAGASEYQLQITSECSLVGFRDCAFSSPVVDTNTTATVFRSTDPLPISNEVPVGRRYYWRVRACHAQGCSSYSVVRYLDVGRDQHDLNGDGYADLVVGAISQDAPEEKEGNTFVYYGSARGLSAEPDVTLDNPLDLEKGRFGVSVASAGDVNGDGYADLVVGAAYQSDSVTGEGNAYVYYGSASGVSADPDVTLDNPLNNRNGLFGTSAASAGDVNGDGYADLVVGAYAQDTPEPSEGSAYIYYGSASGLNAEPDVSLDNPLNQQYGYFGRAVASAGDVNGDGYVDLVVGANGQANPESNEGTAYIYYGSVDGLGTDPDVVLDNPLDQTGGFFGVSVASAGDVNGDGYDDLVIGARYQNNPETSEGTAYVYHGSAAGIKASPDVSLDNPLDQTYSNFGFAASGAGDINGDGFADIVVGAYSQDNPQTGEGNAYIYYGTTTGISTEPDATLDNPLGSERGYFGFAVAGAGDTNGDGYSDVVIGAYNQDVLSTNDGAAYVYHGTSAGLNTRPNINLENPTGQAGGYFGAAVASIDCGLLSLGSGWS